MSTAKERAAPEYQLRLYVAGQTPKSLAAIDNLQRICETHLAGRYKIELVDLLVKVATANQMLVSFDHKSDAT